MLRGSNLSADIGIRLKDTEVVFLAEEIASRFSRSIARPGDLIFTCWGTVGQIGLIGNNNRYSEYLVSNKQMKMTSDPSRASALFLYYYLSSPSMMAFVRGQAIGSSVPGFNLGQLKALPVKVPSLAVQCAIAELLGALDDKIAANDLIARSSLGLAKAIYLREHRAGAWERVTLADACARGWLQLSDGYRTKRSEHGEPGLRILRAGDVGFDSINPSGGDFVSDEFRASIGSKASQPGDVILTTKGTVGRVAVVPSGMEQVVYSPQLCYFRVVDPTRLAPGFLSAWFRSDDLQRQAEARMFKSDMAPYINLGDIQSMTMPVAPPADQRRIGESQSALERMAQAVLHENITLAHTRDELLPLLMSGKVRVRGAERVVGGVL